MACLLDKLTQYLALTSSFATKANYASAHKIPVGDNKPILMYRYSAEVWQHRSSAAPWLYAAGVLDWLCVDLPITCVENALLITGCAAAIGGAMQSSANSYSSGSSSSGDSGSSYSPPSQYEIRSFYHSQGM